MHVGKEMGERVKERKKEHNIYKITYKLYNIKGPYLVKKVSLDY